MLLIKQFSPASCYFLSLLGPNILLSNVLKHPQSMFFLHGERPSFVPIETDIPLYILIFMFSDR
jgi:hypothetical protein